MGMAASQARFLTLTGRKSNVEYQGQQVNQERLQLANESANIFTQLSQLDVPTPPRVQDFNKTEYSFSTSEVDGTQRTYTFNDIQSAPSGDQVSLSWDEDNYQASVDSWVKNSSAAISTKGSNEDRANGSYITISGRSYQVFSQQVKNDPGTYETLAASNKDFADSIRGENGSINKDAYVYYYMEGGEKHVLQLSDEDKQKLAVTDFLSKLGAALDDPNTAINEPIKGLSSLNGETINCTMVSKNKENAAQNGYEKSVYVTVPTKADRDDFLKYIPKSCPELAGTEIRLNDGSNSRYHQIVYDAQGNLSIYSGHTPSDEEGIDSTISSKDNNMTSYHVVNNPKTQTDIFKVSSYGKSDNGRINSLVVNVDGIDKEFEVTVSSVQDEEAYNQAMLDYEYQKAQYEKQTSDLNSKTETIQQQDKQLELHLKQLDTEQSAIKTEMDAVQKVIEDNTESTFKTFG